VFVLASVALMAWKLRIPTWNCDDIGGLQINNWHCEGADFGLELINGPPIVFAQPLANL